MKKFLIKLPKLSKDSYILLSFTWGILVTLIGAVIAAALYVLGEEPHKNRLGWVFKVSWVKGAGVSFGPFAITPKKPTAYLLQHEFGHSIQNCYLGPFWIVLVGIPSMVRFWYRDIKKKKEKISEKDLPAYDSAWFEGSATELGGLY